MTLEPESGAARAAERSRLTSRVLFVVVMVVAVLAFLRFAFDVHRTPSVSMFPTFEPRDLFVANALSRSPQRGDVVVFLDPDGSGSRFAKRVVGVAGDVVGFEDGHLVVAGERARECRVGEYALLHAESGVRHRGEIFLERVGARTYAVFYREGAGIPGNLGPWQVPEGQLWVAGDNRNDSLDSRLWNDGIGRGVAVGDVEGTVVGAGARLPADADPALGAALSNCEAELAP